MGKNTSASGLLPVVRANWNASLHEVDAEGLVLWFSWLAVFLKVTWSNMSRYRTAAKAKTFTPRSSWDVCGLWITQSHIDICRIFWPEHGQWTYGYYRLTLIKRLFSSHYCRSPNYCLQQFLNFSEQYNCLNSRSLNIDYRLMTSVWWRPIGRLSITAETNEIKVIFYIFTCTCRNL